MSIPRGRHFLQIPGPTNVPDRVLRAIARPTIDHRGPEFSVLGREVLEGLKEIFKTSGKVVIFPASGSGAWEAALVNTLSPGDRVLMFETGQFAALWREMAGKLGLDVNYAPGDWRHGVDPDAVEAQLREDSGHRIKGVMVVHNETSTGVTSNILAVRKAIDAAKHPALLIVDSISGLASADFRHDEWGVDVTVSGSQKGLMLPPGLSFNAVGPKALAATKSARLPRSYWDWNEIIAANQTGYFPWTPATNLLYGLHEALDMLAELAGDPELRLDMNFMPGDIQFLHNHTILHARSAYEDWPEPDRKRHLLRLWRPPLRPGQWRTDEVAPLSPHPNDPAGSP
jgi:alanine-glyoxylate transaminase/serine-glyoxylate transaminase/serine-pyruvate transaminase